MAVLLITALVVAATCFGNAAGTSKLGSQPGYITYDLVAGSPYAVTYDQRSFFINGSRTLFQSGCIHYPRSTPLMWDDLFVKAKNDGFNMVQTYWFWNAHQHKENDWEFSFNTDLKLFLDKAAAHGLFVNFRIGPYVCAEWNYGGYPVWINSKANLTTRSSNAVWEDLMGTAFNRIIAHVREYFADRGGPIVLAQVENEYNAGATVGSIGQPDMAYVAWCGALAAKSGVPIPFEMCNGESSNETINSCNGNDCSSFIENHGQNGRVLIDQPAMWTENEEWFQQWGQPYPDTQKLPPPFGAPSRTATNLAYSVARWIARGGSHHNYYMWHGGNHYGRMAGASVANWYANGGNLNSDALANEPYRTHVQTLHWLIVQNAATLLGSPAQVWNRTYLERFDATTGKWVPGDNTTIAFVYANAAGCVTFLENSAPALREVRFPGTTTPTFTLENASVQILDGTGAVLYDTSDVPTTAWTRTYTPITPGPLSWSMFPDGGINGVEQRGETRSRRLQSSSSTVGTVTAADHPLEQLGVTEDDTEYMLYSRVVSSAELSVILSSILQACSGKASAVKAALGTVPLLISGQIGQAFIAYVDGQYKSDTSNITHSFKTVGTAFVGSANFTLTVNLTSAFAWGGEGDDAWSIKSSATLSILSESLGLDNGHGTWVVDGVVFTQKGILSNVSLGGVSIATGATWTHTSGLRGELLEVFSAAGAANVTWQPVPSGAPVNTLPTWYRTFFTTPSSMLKALTSSGQEEVRASLLLDIGLTYPTLGRGHFYLNGFDCGRYWSIIGYNTTSPSQSRYMLPPDLLVPDISGGNTLTLVDVLPGTSLDVVRIVLSELVPASLVRTKHLSAH